MNKTLKEFDAFIQSAVEDFADSDQDPSDYCWEVADGSQYAIYYSHAWDLVNAMREWREDDLVAAEMDYTNLFPSTDGADFCIDKTMTRLAYILTHAQLAQELQPA